MHRTVLVLGCLVCTGHTRRASVKPHPNNKSSDAKLGTLKNGIRDPSPLLRLLLEIDPAASFNPSGPAMWGRKSAIPPVSALRRVAFPSRTSSQVTAFFDKLPELPNFGSSNEPWQFLEYVNEEVGEGPACDDGDTVSVRYVGRTRRDEKVFDTGEISFKLGENRVIKGWDLGIKGMKKGGFRTLKIPARLAYGEKGSGEDIPPNSDLEFDVEVVAITGDILDLDGVFGDMYRFGRNALKTAVPFFVIVSILVGIYLIVAYLDGAFYEDAPPPDDGFDYSNVLNSKKPYDGV